MLRWRREDACIVTTQPPESRADTPTLAVAPSSIALTMIETVSEAHRTALSSQSSRCSHGSRTESIITGYSPAHESRWQYDWAPPSSGEWRNQQYEVNTTADAAPTRNYFLLSDFVSAVSGDDG